MLLFNNLKVSTKTAIGGIFTLIFISAVLLWLKAGIEKGRKAYFENKAKEVKGKIVMVYKTSIDKDFVALKLSDSSYCDVPFFGFGKNVQIGDSIYKAGNSLRYVIYKNSNATDSIVFMGKNSVYE